MWALLVGCLSRSPDIPNRTPHWEKNTPEISNYLQNCVSPLVLIELIG